MSSQPKVKESRLQIIADGISKLFSTNKNLAWFLIIISIISAIQNLTYRTDYVDLEQNTEASYNVGQSEAGWIALFFVIFLIPFVLAMLAVFVFIHGMLSYAALEASRGRVASIKQTFAATKEKFWTLFGVGIIVFLKVLGGLILFIVPGIRAMCRYYVIGFVVFDKNLPADETVKYTKKLTKGKLTAPFLAIIGSIILSPVAYLIQYGSMAGIYPWLKKESKA